MHFAYRLSDNTELRLLEPRHAAEIYALIERNRDYLGRWVRLGTVVQSVDDVMGYIKQALGRFAEDGSPFCGIWHDGALVGTVDLKGVNSNSQCGEIGYWLDEAYQGRGLITQSCRALVNHAFGVLSANRIEIRAAPFNTRSRAVAERLGFNEEGTLRQACNMGEYCTDSVVYAQLREEWDGTGAPITFTHPLTEDAELRLLMPQDAEPLFALIEQNREHLRWMTFTEGTRSVEDLQAFIRHTLRELAEGIGYNLAIVYQGRLAGILGAGGINRNSQKVEIGYWLAEEFQGKGLMTHAGREVLAHLFDTVGLNRIEVRCDVRNTRSRALAERLGFIYEGTKRQADKIGGEFVDMHYFGLLRKDWEALQ